mmetsp:Transcript_39274/g.76704  ORF Transcript_39274/g.76704 Transcript_39274/m.76704 type:complete len:85 (-) Transcript_39274:473-727(-)
MDNFGAKHVNKENADHIVNALKQTYQISEDWEDALYCGITFKWNYQKRYLDISTPKYVNKQLLKYLHKNPKTTRLASRTSPAHI